MSFSDELKRIRQCTFLSQEYFAKEVNVSVSTVNRWKRGNTLPNFVAIKKIKVFCECNNFEYGILEEEWLIRRTEER